MKNEEALELIRRTERCYVVWARDRNEIVAVHPVGSSGSSEEYGSPSEALRAVEKKINEKLHKGYEMTTKGAKEKKPIPRRAKPSAEEQLQNLSACGILLKSGMSKEILFTEYEPEDYANEPYLPLLTALGGETEEEPYGFLSSNIWHFDTECIYDHGDYARIALRMEGRAATYRSKGLRTTLAWKRVGTGCHSASTNNITGGSLKSITIGLTLALGEVKPPVHL